MIVLPLESYVYLVRVEGSCRVPESLVAEARQGVWAGPNKANTGIDTTLRESESQELNLFPVETVFETQFTLTGGPVRGKG